MRLAPYSPFRWLNGILTGSVTEAKLLAIGRYYVCGSQTKPQAVAMRSACTDDEPQSFHIGALVNR